MDRPLGVRGVLVRMTGNAEGLRRSRDEFNAGYVFVNADLMTTGTSHRNRGMNEFAFRLVLVALDTFR